MLLLISTLLFISTLLLSFLLIQAKKQQQQEAGLQQQKSESQQLEIEQLKNELTGLREQKQQTDQQNKQAIKTVSQTFNVSSTGMEQIAFDMSSIESKLSDNQNNIHNLSENINTTQVYSISHQSKLNDVSQSLQELLEAQEALDEISALTQEINEKTKLISHVSTEAEMLSLNAAIEAARAGDAGRGFAVVAESIKRLSQQSHSSSIEIEKLISKSVRQMDNTTANVTDKIENLQNSLQELFTDTQSLNVQISDTAKLSQLLDQDFAHILAQSQNLQANSQTQLETQISQLAHLMGEVSGSKIIDLTVRQVKEKLAKYELIDVRSENEYNDELGHIKNSRLMVLQNEFEKQIHDLNKDKHYLFICRSGGRSAKAACIAKAKGFNYVYNMQGGMLEWKKANYASF